jgi:carbon storage regulator
MLVLSRKVGERIHIGNDVVLTVVAIDGHRIRLGVEAPGDVPIRREELADRPLVVAAEPRPPAKGAASCVWTSIIRASH